MVFVEFNIHFFGDELMNIHKSQRSIADPKFQFQRSHRVYLMDLSIWAAADVSSGGPRNAPYEGRWRVYLG